MLALEVPCAPLFERACARHCPNGQSAQSISLRLDLAEGTLPEAQLDELPRKRLGELLHECVIVGGYFAPEWVKAGEHCTVRIAMGGDIGERGHEGSTKAEWNAYLQRSDPLPGCVPVTLRLVKQAYEAGSATLDALVATRRAGARTACLQRTHCSRGAHRTSGVTGTSK